MLWLHWTKSLWGERMKSKYYQYFSGTWPTILTFILLALSITGCETLGPKAINAGRTDYNSAINKTDVEQLLLNIVRMRPMTVLTFWKLPA